MNANDTYGVSMTKSTTQSLAERLRQVADLFPSREAAASAAGVSYPQLNRYLNGTTKIPLVVAMRLAEPFAISIDWIANGNGAMIANVENVELAQSSQRMLQVSEGVDRFLAADGLSLPRSKRNSLIQTIYDMSAESADTHNTNVDLDRFSEVIRLVAKG